MRIKQKRQIFYLALAVLIYYAASSWLAKPYCTIEHQDRETIRGRKPVWMYVLSKVYAQRRELVGEPDHAFYLYIEAPNGIYWAYITVDGYRYPLSVPYGATSYSEELTGVKTIGWHTYALDVMDYKGGRGHSICYMKISAKE